MFRVAANLNYLFTEVELVERYGAAAAVGFSGVETLVPYVVEAPALRAELDRWGLEQVLINAPLGDVERHGMTLSTDPARQEEFRSSIDRAAEYLVGLDCSRLHVVAGVADRNGADRARATFLDNLCWTSARLEELGVDGTIMVEPLNTRDNPGYVVSTTAEALELIAGVEAARPDTRIQLQFDTYHLQIMEGDLTHRFEEVASSVGHVQVSSVPGRAEPTRGEINHEFFLEVLARSGYSGWVAGEYRPTDGTLASFDWAKAYGIDPAGIADRGRPFPS